MWHRALKLHDAISIYGLIFKGIVMKAKFFIVITISLMLIAFSSVFAQSKMPGHHIDEKRYINSMCPPEYAANRNYLSRYLKADHLGGKLRRIFGESAPKSIDDIDLMRDETHGSGCWHFSQLYEQSINKQARFFEDGEAEYWHDFTFYQSSEFYFIVSSAGFLIQEDPNQPGKERMGWFSTDPLTIYDRHSLEPIQIDFMDDPADRSVE